MAKSESSPSVMAVHLLLLGLTQNNGFSCKMVSLGQKWPTQA